MKHLEARIQAVLKEREQKGSLRELYVAEGLVDFASNDYLGFAAQQANDPDVHTLFPVGATGSRLISGNSPLAEELESEIAHFHQAEAALLFTSGYSANVGLLASAPQRGDTILYDQLIHASLRDGIRLSPAHHFSFKHNDISHLQSRLEQSTGQVFIVVESLYSMDGDEAPLKEIAQLSRAYGAALIVDEAHATGVFGPKGEGLVVALGLQQEVWCRIHTFGKAMGAHGSAVVGPSYLRNYLINYARSFIYTTALPDSLLAVIQSRYRQLPDTVFRAQLHRNISLFRTLAKEQLRQVPIQGRGPIQSLIIGGNSSTKSLAQALVKEGLHVKAILHPTVPLGTERIRISLHAFNTDHEIRKLIGCLNRYIAAFSMPEDVRSVSSESSSS